MHHSAALLTSLLSSLVAASPAPRSLSVRQTDERIDACNANTCSQENGECPLYGATSGAYPGCVIYDTEGFTTERGYPRTESGQIQAWFDFPQPDTGCRYLLRSPAGVTTYENCGIPVITVSAPACQLVTLENTFMLQNCCGDDCQDAGGIGSRLAASSGSAFIMHDKEGNPLPGITGQPGNESSIASLNVDTPEKARRVAAMPEARHLADVQALAKRDLSKRDCTFEKTEGPYTKLADYSEYVAGPFSCPQGGTCTQEITEEYSISRSISVGVSVSDPFGIIEASLEVTFEESYTYSISQSFTFPESSTGYVSSTPILECYKGYWSGCDDENEDEFEVCQVNPGTPKAVDSAVITRSKKRGAALEIEEVTL